MRKWTNEELLKILWSNTVITPSGCYEWTGPRRTNSKGEKTYGYIMYGASQQGVHRLSAMIHHGFDINSKLDVLHSCNNPPCWRPEHVKGGARKANLEGLSKRRAGKGTWRG